MGIGAYRHHVTLAHPAAELDPPDWFCAIQSAAAQVIDGQAAFFVRGQYHPGLTLETQINFEGRTFQVQSVSDVDERHVELVLMCVEVVGRGKSLDRAPFITVQPVSTLVMSGTGATLTVQAGGTPPLSYQWMKDGIILPGATGASVATGPLMATATYTVRVANAEGFVTSTAATVTVVAPPTITTQPQSTSIASGESVTLTVVATGTPPLAYQWTKDGVDLAGATAASYVTGPLTTTAVYAVRVANAYGSVTSSAATVVVVPIASPLLTDLVSYWTLDEASGTRADAHGTNHLTDHNAVLGAVGKIAGGAVFDAAKTNYLSRASNPTLQPLDHDFTFTLWMHPATAPVLVGLLEKGSPYQIYGSDIGDIRFQFNGGAVIVAHPLQLLSGTWYFVVAWFDATANTINLQINNGATFTADSGTVFPNITADDFVIGALSGGAFPFNGLLDEVGFWTRVLTPAERTALWNAGNGLAYPFA